jgi:hypothetical protein
VTKAATAFRSESIPAAAEAPMQFKTIALLLMAALIPVGALADEQTTEGQTVTERPRPEYDPLGQRVGGFILYPDVDVRETYDSNINASNTVTHGDFITSVRPSLQLKSDWNRHALNFHANSNIVHYAQYDNNDYTDYSVGGDGRLDIHHDARLFANAGYSILHLPWWSPNTFTGQGKPTEYSDTAFGLAGEKEFNRLSFRLDQNYDRYDFSNVVASGSEILESKNDYADERLNLHSGYELMPGRQVYALTGYDWRIYDKTSDLFGYNRNSNGYILALGTKYDVTGITFFDVYVGYRQQDYDDARLGAIAGPTGGAKLTWNVTTLTTITGNVTRDIDETLIAHSSGYFATTETVRADHELLRNLLLNATVGHETDDFVGINRSDDYLLFGAGAKYLMNENLWLTGGYAYRSRSSNLSGTGAGDNQVFLGISTHL